MQIKRRLAFTDGCRLASMEIAIDAVLGSMGKLGQFATTLQHARSAPVWRQACGNVPRSATEAGWIESETRRPPSIRRVGGV